MDRLFLDANVLFSAAYRPNAGLLEFWEFEKVILCSSRHALEEALFNLDEKAQKDRLARLARRIHFFDAPLGEPPGGVSLPEKDRPILLAAIEARATHLITGDVRHFGPYFGKTIAGVLVLAPYEYLQQRRKR